MAAKHTLGLSTHEAHKRLVSFGPNELETTHRLAVVAFFTKFKSPLILVLITAAVASAVFRDWTSATLIIVIVVISAALDFFNTYRADRAVALLRERVKVTTSVLRDGEFRELPVRQVVPDDVVRLSPGDIIPADGVVIESTDFFVNESSLTGESFPVEKEKGNSTYMGSSVVSGSATLHIMATGKQTKFGAIAETISHADGATQFDNEIRDFSYLVIRIMFVLVVFVFFVNAASRHNLLDSFLFAVALAVGLTPELLPMIITLNLTKGALVMSRHGVIVKRLSAIQNCGSMDILCTDKTGTLTEDSIELVKYVDAHGKISEEVLRFAYINSTHRTGLVNPLDKAILEFRHVDMSGYKKVEEIPFDFKRRRDSIGVDHSGKHLLITKGAPENIFEISAFYQTEHTRFRGEFAQSAKREYEKLSADGFRVLGVAVKTIHDKRLAYTKEEETGMTFLGFVAFLDPPKKTVTETIRFLEAHGIEIKVLTGDNEFVTKRIASVVGLPVKGVVRGDDIAELSDAALRIQVERNTIFARVAPDQKLRIIKALQEAGHGVGYLGDGINDAPSLKEADVGISVNNAVDVAKESADLIVLHKSLRDLGNGVVEGRRTFVNTLKYLMMALSSNFGNMFSMAAATLFLPFFPMLPAQILLNNLLYDTSQFALPLDSVDPAEIQQPRRFNIGFLKKFMLTFGPLSSVFDLVTFILLLAVFRLPENGFQTGWFIESLVTQMLVVYVVRTRVVPFWRSQPSRALVVGTLSIIAIGLGIALTRLGSPFGFTSLPWPVLLAITLVALVYIVAVEYTKLLFYRSWQKEDAARKLAAR